MYGYLLTLIILIFVSCNETKIDNFYADTNKRWFATYRVEKINDNYESLDDINEPKGTIQPLLRIHYYQSDFESVSDCLFYRVSTLKDGEITIVQNPLNLNCKQLLLKKPYAKKSNIQNFGITITENILELHVDKEKIVYKLFNISKGRAEKLLSPSSKTSMIFAANVQSITNSSTLKNGDLCKQVKDDCTVALDTCSRCNGSSYYLINSKCTTGYSRVCGVDHCGQKNEAACIRGVATSGIDMDFYCVNDSPVGFCSDDLRVVCINGALYCE
jgi:hypothetical protein